MTYATLEVLRQDASLGIKPHFDIFKVPVEEENKTTVLEALEYVLMNLDSSLSFRRYCCGLQSCNSCLMEIDGKAAPACHTLVEGGRTTRVKPLEGKVARDLIVDK
ncbi:MAG TPA: 2Fe-2S iron-sulfur cluster-binding protein [Candidatus Cryosericum sp.]